jgi:hypothetical protein
MECCHIRNCTGQRVTRPRQFPASSSEQPKCDETFPNLNHLDPTATAGASLRPIIEKDYEVNLLVDPKQSNPIRVLFSFLDFSPGHSINQGRDSQSKAIALLPYERSVGVRTRASTPLEVSLVWFATSHLMGEHGDFF